MKKVIIITETWEQCNQLHKHFEGNNTWEKQFQGHYPYDKKIYNSTWYWKFDDNGSLSGSSGTGSFEQTVKNCPKGTPTYYWLNYEDNTHKSERCNVAEVDEIVAGLSKMQVKLMHVGISNDEYNDVTEFLHNAKEYLVNMKSYNR